MKQPVTVINRLLRKNAYEPLAMSSGSSVFEAAVP
jgi:hypothetical protein